MKQSTLKTDTELLSELFDKLPIPVWVKDEDHRHVLANDAFCSHFGLKKEDLIGTSDMPNLTIGRMNKIWKAEKQVLMSGVPDVNTMRMNFRDGKHHKVLITKSLIRLHDNIKYILAVLDDVTEKDSLVKRLK
ncbi:MAG: PAS domain S-box protein, partial [Bacteroidota bacterium]